MFEAGGAPYCDHCGQQLERFSHDACHVARELEPPRYCRWCRRRLVVQVTPRTWSARCVEHGEFSAAR